MYWQCDLYFKKFLLLFYIFCCNTLYLQASLINFVVSSSVLIKPRNNIDKNIIIRLSSWLEELSYSLSHHGYLIMLKETYENYKSRIWENSWIMARYNINFSLTGSRTLSFKKFLFLKSWQCLTCVINIPPHIWRCETFIRIFIHVMQLTVYLSKPENHKNL